MGEFLPEENDEWESDPLHPHPDERAVEVGLHHAGLALLQLKRVKEPEGEVEEGQEGDTYLQHAFRLCNEHQAHTPHLCSSYLGQEQGVETQKISLTV